MGRCQGVDVAALLISPEFEGIKTALLPLSVSGRFLRY